MALSWVSWLWGQKKVQFYSGEETIPIVTNSGGTKSLAEIVKSITPSCYLNPFLFNGHLQTMYTAAKGDEVPIVYKRGMFEQEDPKYHGQFSVDFVARSNVADSKQKETQKEDDGPWSLPPRTSYFTEEEWANIGSDDNKPMLVTLHGLSGGSHELYLRHVLAPLTEGGWEALVVNARGCARTKITSSVLYNARATWDIRQVVKWLREKFPNRPLFGIGYSLGGNIITNYIGEEGENCVFKAAVVVSNPWNLDIGNTTLLNSFLGYYLYSKTLGVAMKKLVRRHKDMLSKNPRIDLPKVMKVQHLYQFDRLVQAPAWGYPTEGAYYRDASSTDMVTNVRIPFMAVHAEDDPVTHRRAIAFEELKANPFSVLVTTSCGGHLGWFEWGGGRWYVKPVVAFLNKMAQDVNEAETAKATESIKKGLREPAGEADAHYLPLRRRLHYPHTDREDGSQSE